MVYTQVIVRWFVASDYSFVVMLLTTYLISHIDYDCNNTMEKA